MTMLVQQEKWYCKDCTVNGKDCGPWLTTESFFPKVKQIHNTHPGWQKGQPEIKKDGYDELIQKVVKVVSDGFQNQERILKTSSEEYQSEIIEEFKRLTTIIETLCPNRSLAIEVCLSVKAQMKIEGVTQVLAIILMGNPSTYKSTVLEIISCLPDSYVSDNFTSKSFVSHSANSKKSELENIDLLPRIKHQTFITPELAPLFSANPDQLVENIGILTRVLDGRGLQTDSGVHGKRGYKGDYSFCWLGAIVDIPHKVWKLLGNLGPKICFLRLPQDTKSEMERLDQIMQILKENPYQQKLEECKLAIKRYWNYIQSRFDGTDQKIVWDSEKDDKETIQKIIKLAMVLGSLRASIPTWHTGDSDSGGSNYHFEMPVKEEPSRASNSLYNLARGHAVLFGRNFVIKEDLRVVIPVVLSSAPRERVELFRLLIENGGELNTQQFMDLAKVSRATTLKEMGKLELMGLVNKSQDDGNSKPFTSIKLKPEYNWFLSEDFKRLCIQSAPFLIPKNSKLSQENLEKETLSEKMDSYM